MTNAVIGSIAQSNTTYNLVNAAKEVTIDILKNTELLTTLKNYGAINTDADEIIGDTVNFYNLNRVDSNGLSESDDSYSNAADSVYGQRQLIMGAVNYTHKARKKNTMTAIRAETTVRDLKKGIREIMTQWGRSNIVASLLNQIAGNTATSISRVELSGTAFSGSTLNRVTGLNSVSAIEAGKFFYGNNNAGAPANPAAITSTNYATLVDFMNIESNIFNVEDEQNVWTGFDSSAGCRALVLISRTNWNQMMNYAPVSNSYANLAFERYQALSAAGSEKSRATGKMIGNYRVYESIFTPDLHYLVVDDHVLPRCVSSNAAVANTRVALIIGKNAVDMKVGSMLPQIPNDQAAFNIRLDDQHEKLNNLDYFKLEMKYGLTRCTLQGTGSKAGTQYETGVAVLNLYSAT